MVKHTLWQIKIAEYAASLTDEELLVALLDAFGSLCSEFGTGHDQWEAEYLEVKFRKRMGLPEKDKDELAFKNLDF